jgi:hypothetical protein
VALLRSLNFVGRKETQHGCDVNECRNHVVTPDHVLPMVSMKNHSPEHECYRVTDEKSPDRRAGVINPHAGVAMGEAEGEQPWPVPDPRSAWRKISLTTSPPKPAPTQFRQHLNRAKLEIPIDHHHSPAGSGMGGFPTPDGIRKPSPCRSLGWSRPLLRSRH